MALDVGVLENIISATNSNLMNQVKKVKSRNQTEGDGDESLTCKRPICDSK